MPSRLVVVALAALVTTGSPSQAAQPGEAGVQRPCDAGGCASEPAFEQWQQAQRLRYGYGMTGRAEVAAAWYRRSAEKGDARAMHNYGLMLARGHGVPPDPAAGRDWLARAMAAGIAESAFALGQMARLGIGAPADPARARAHFLFAAERGQSRAMHALGNMHAGGLGGPPSLAEAYYWYLMAAEKGHLLAERARDAAAARLPDRLRRQAEARAAEWRRARRR